MAYEAKKPTDKQSDAELLRTARERFKRCVDAESELRRLQLEDKKFAAGEHWPVEISADRRSDGRPCLVIDRLTPQIKQVTNQQRAMRPAIQVDPVDNGADVDTAEVLQGIIRHIESRSNADDAYDQAGRDQAEIGRGWFRILTEYLSDEGFDQEIKIKRVRNPFTVYPDPAVQERDYADMSFLFCVEDLPLEEYRQRWPRAKVSSAQEFQSLGDDLPRWLIDGQRVRVAEYWTVKTESVDVQAPDGGRSRKAERRTVCCYTISGAEVLERHEWAGKYIPFVPVLGEELDLDGRIDLRGMVRRAKDPQRMLNFWKSAQTEAIALAPKAPVIAAEGQLEPYKSMWQQANRRNFPYLLYKPTTLGGSLVPPPARQQAEPPIQALMASTQAAENDLRAVTGFFDVDAVADRKEVSGKAILARQRQGELGNSDFLDGLSRAIRHAGRILIDLIPHIYDVPRVLRITGKDNKPRSVMVHAGNAPMELPQGVQGVYDLSTGIYDVTVTAGPSFQSARQEFVETFGELLGKRPEMMQIAGDVYFENLDLPNAKAIAERMRKLLPPQLQDEQGQQDPAVLQGQLQQAGQQMQAMQQALMELQQKLESKQLEVESKERIAAAELQSKERLAELELQIERQKAMIEAQIEIAKMQAQQQAAAMQAQAQIEAQGREHAHAASMADRESFERAADRAAGGSE